MQESEEKTVVFDGQCVICLAQQLHQPAMLMPCFHSFCTGCISIWLERSDKCPLCNTIAERIIYDIQSESQYKQVNLPSFSNDNVTASELLDIEMNIPHHPFRQRVYFTPLRCVHDKNIHKFPGKLVSELDAQERVRQWVVRDLEAILRTYRVQILTEYIMALVKKHNLTTEKEMWIRVLKEYIDDLAERFVEELEMFISSTLSIQGYDRSVKYEAAAVEVIEDDEANSQESRIESRLKRKRSQNEAIVIEDNSPVSQEAPQSASSEEPIEIIDDGDTIDDKEVEVTEPVRKKRR
jgi:hypothetical protein